MSSPLLSTSLGTSPVRAWLGWSALTQSPLLADNFTQSRLLADDFTQSRLPADTFTQSRLLADVTM